MNTRELREFSQWFDILYENMLGVRHPTMKSAIMIFLQNNGNTIVETGCLREENDWGGGCSTTIFGGVCKKYSKFLYTVDISEENINNAKRITKAFSDCIIYTTSNSLDFLEKFTGKIDLLYLDSLDFPYGKILEDYGGKEDIEKARRIVSGLTDEFVIEKYKDTIQESQEHCLKELECSIEKVTQSVLIDDIQLPASGKGRLAKELLQDNKFTCILEGYQTLWTRI